MIFKLKTILQFKAYKYKTTTGVANNINDVPILSECPSKPCQYANMHILSQKTFSLVVVGKAQV